MFGAPAAAAESLYASAMIAGVIFVLGLSEALTAVRELLICMKAKKPEPKKTIGLFAYEWMSATSVLAIEGLAANRVWWARVRSLLARSLSAASPLPAVSQVVLCPVREGTVLGTARARAARHGPENSPPATAGGV